MSYSFDAFDQAASYLDTAEDRLRMASVMMSDVAQGWLTDPELDASLDHLYDLLSASRRAMSQALAWLEQSIAYLETEARDDGAGARGEREGQGQALPDA